MNSPIKSIQIHSLVGDKDRLNVEAFNNALTKFQRNNGSYSNLLTMNENGTIIVGGFSNETMVRPVALLLLLCEAYPQIFSFQFQESMKVVAERTETSLTVVAPDGGLPKLGFWIKAKRYDDAMEILINSRLS